MKQFFLIRNDSIFGDFVTKCADVLQEEEGEEEEGGGEM